MYFSWVMTKLNRQNILAFAWAAITLFALYVVPASFDDQSSIYNCDSSWQSALVGEGYSTSTDNESVFLEDPFSGATEAAFWGNRRPTTQLSLRPQRSGPLYRHNGRDGGVVKNSGLRPVASNPNFSPESLGFPTPLSYRVPKEYYVFTLERILC